LANLKEEITYVKNKFEVLMEDIHGVLFTMDNEEIENEELDAYLADLKDRCQDFVFELMAFEEKLDAEELKVYECEG
jgi:hypothetical protein